MRLELGSPVAFGDGSVAELADVVVDPASKRVTHLVVQPNHRHRLARLVPIELVDGDDSQVPSRSLRCTAGDLSGFPRVQEFAYLQLSEFPPYDPDWDVGIQGMLSTPGSVDVSIFGGYPITGETKVGITYDRVPKGKVEISGDGEVSSVDGQPVGHVHAFVVGGDEQITALVLERGHLWRRREVTVPIGAVARVRTDAVTLSLSPTEVEGLEAGTRGR